MPTLVSVPALSFTPPRASATDFSTIAGNRRGTRWWCAQTDLFLASLGYTKGAPTVTIPADSGAVLKKALP